MFTRLLSILLLSLSSLGVAVAQSVPETEQLIIIRFQENINPQHFVRLYNASHSLPVKYGEVLIASKNMHTLRCNAYAPLPLQELEQFSSVIYAFADEEITFYDTGYPNDPDISEQYHIARTQTDDAWEYANGDSTANGHPIVIGIVDFGFELDHVEIADNVYINPHEIPNDGIDNDQNGLVDDVNGWNLADDTPVPNSSDGSHGVPVAGLAAGVANNGTLGAGVAYGAKLMLFSTNTSSANVLKGYGYFTEIRRRFNETDGQYGTLIVAVNSSLGIKNSDGQYKNCMLEYAHWNDAMDAMGEEGILSVVAARNAEADGSLADVEELGDIPTTCSSPYILAVHGTDQLNELVFSYGETSIDIAAPGKDINAPYPGNILTEINGNSFAAPQVAGLVALLYSTPCTDLMQEMERNPAEAALLVKQFVLNGGTPYPQLKGRNASGARMNSFGSIKELLNYCDGIQPNSMLAINKITPNPASTSVVFELNLPIEGTYKVRVHDPIGRLVMQDTYEVTAFEVAPYVIDDLKNLVSGLYYITFDNGKQRATAGFVVTHP